MPSIGSTIQRRAPPPVDPELLAEHAVVRALDREPLADRRLDRPVGLCHRRQVGLRLDEQVARAEAAERDRVGRVGERESECKVGAHASPDLSRPLLLRGGDEPELRLRDRQLQRLRPAHELVTFRQGTVDAADPVPPAAGLERKRRGGASVDRDALDRAPRIAGGRPLDLVRVCAGGRQPRDERASVEGLRCRSRRSGVPTGRDPRHTPCPDRRRRGTTPCRTRERGRRRRHPAAPRRRSTS